MPCNCFLELLLRESYPLLVIYYFYPSPFPLVCLSFYRHDRSACRPSCMFICLPSWTDPFADHFVCLFVYYHGQIRLQTILYVYLFTIMDRSICRPFCMFICLLSWTYPLADHLVCLSVYYHRQIRLQTIL